MACPAYRQPYPYTTQRHHITTAGLQHLCALPYLENLDIAGTRVDDGALEVLRRCPELTAVELDDTQTSLGARNTFYEEMKQRLYTALRANEDRPLG